MDGRVPAGELRRHVGRFLREAREAAGSTQAAVARAAGCSQGKIQKVEVGAASINPAELERVIAFLRIPEELAAQLTEWVAQDSAERRNEATEPDWTAWGLLVDMEEHASEIRCLHAERIPGPLQSEQYMLQVLTEVFPGFDVSEVVLRRRRRSRILTGESGPRYRAILSESSLRRTLRGQPAILLDQAEHLLTLMRNCPRLELRILPFAADRLFVDSDFQILTFPARSSRRDFAYIESAGGAHSFKAAKDLKRFGDHWSALYKVAWTVDETEKFLSELVN